MKPFSQILTVSFLAMFMMLGTSCGEKSKNKNESVVLKAYRLIDSQRDDEAIALLEDALSKDPQNYEYKAVLASAYAHKAGIKIQKLVPVVNEARDLNKMKSTAQALKKSAPNSSKADKLARNISFLLGKFAQAFDVYTSVPVISKDQATYLQHAIYLLNELGDSIQPGEAVYRAILNIVYFKFLLTENVIGEFMPPTDKNIECRFDLAKVNQSFIDLGKLLIDIASDIGFANAKQAKSMRTLSDEVASSVSDLTIGMTSLIVLDEASDIFLQNAVIQHGFGKLVKCGGE